ncbi:acyl-CoA N-acyltransferase [Mycena metata]|uniref:Acyl-CoA N-acyltransferase n=1 Tax=Mycena metata TaxID=1033252 RepID=A0AAD7JJK4_9AGAR|nr:acyl-CoA N-acyltransferase [Mycena metata]
MADITLVPAISPELKAHCIRIRKTVFVQEQGYTHVDEDNQPEDTIALHFLLRNAVDDGFMGTARVSVRPEQTCVLSRIALLPPFRGGGMGSKFMRALEEWIRKQGGFYFVNLEAQDGSYGFYEKLGYARQSAEPYIKDGKPHLLMRKDLREAAKE